MLKKILGTAFTRLLSAIAGFAVLILNARQLGADGVGEIGLLIIGIAILHGLSGFFGGSSLVYLASKRDNFTLYSISLIWGFLTTSIGTLILSLLGMLPEAFIIHTALLSLLLITTSTQQMFLLGHERITLFNISTLIQSISLPISLFISFFILKNSTVNAFVNTLYISYGLGFLSSIFTTLQYLSFGKFIELKSCLRDLVKFGGSIQLASLFQTLNYRLSYYLLKASWGMASLGRFDVGVKLSEGLWLIGKSIALIQYSSISNQTDMEINRRITIIFFKASLLFTILGIGLLLLIPESSLIWVFGASFTGVRLSLILLSPGILAIATGMVFSHYFSGSGKPFYNTVGSAIGVVFIAITGIYFIPKFGLPAAASCTSVSYLASLIYLMSRFCRVTNTLVTDFIPTSADFISFIAQLRLKAKSVE
ncbi:MAG: polysaccharide biosynthesis C-terminal domain-containing protein [Bacteroidales bacterium]|jgi:O-antigen/teichoic acid export membrane protein|nr:polysaccharide biosynthesis C-terminal domain-containing protein [Bacteroidales bacterium]